MCLGCEELYLPVCYKHFASKVEEGSGVPLDFGAVNAAEEARLRAEHEEEEASKVVEVKDAPNSPVAKKDGAVDVESPEDIMKMLGEFGVSVEAK